LSVLLAKNSDDTVKPDFANLQTLSQSARDGSIREGAVSLITRINAKIGPYNEMRVKVADLKKEADALQIKVSTLNMEATTSFDINAYKKVAALEPDMAAFDKKLAAADIPKADKEPMENFSKLNMTVVTGAKNWIKAREGTSQVSGGGMAGPGGGQMIPGQGGSQAGGPGMPPQGSPPSGMPGQQVPQRWSRPCGMPGQAGGSAGAPQTGGPAVHLRWQDLQVGPLVLPDSVLVHKISSPQPSSPTAGGPAGGSQNGPPSGGPQTGLAASGQPACTGRSITDRPRTTIDGTTDSRTDGSFSC